MPYFSIKNIPYCIRITAVQKSAQYLFPTWRYLLGHSNKMICFWSPAHMYFWKFPQNIIITIVVTCFLYTKAHQR